MLYFENVSKNYSKTQVLNNITFEIDSNELVFLTGPSGAGKTTLLKLIALDLIPSIGKIWFNKKNIHKFPKNNLHKFKQQIGIIQQSPIFLEDSNVLENVILPLQILGINKKEERYRAKMYLDLVGLHHKINSYPQELSTGERQRLAIARGIISKPKVIIADEPTGNLDKTLAQDILNLFGKINKIGTLTLIATHDLQLIASLPYRILTLHNGSLLE